MWIGLILLIALCLSSIAIGTYASVTTMLASPNLNPAPELEPEIRSALPVAFQAFLQSNGFEFEAVYRFNSLTLGVWCKNETSLPLRRFYISKVMTKSACEFVTQFSDDVSLTTTRTNSAFMFPRPYGAFIHSFPGAACETLWRHHLEGEGYLMTRCSVSVRECGQPMPEGFRLGLVKMLTYVTRLPLWPARGVYWFLVKRFLLQNVPIWKQNIDRLYPRVS